VELESTATDLIDIESLTFALINACKMAKKNMHVGVSFVTRSAFSISYEIPFFQTTKKQVFLYLLVFFGIFGVQLLVNYVSNKFFNRTTTKLSKIN
jgi:hypothetical protein